MRFLLAGLEEGCFTLLSNVSYLSNSREAQANYSACPTWADGVKPFEHIIIDYVGPLPHSKSGYKYLLKIMCAVMGFPEAVPLRIITARTISKEIH